MLQTCCQEQQPVLNCIKHRRSQLRQCSGYVPGCLRTPQKVHSFHAFAQDESASFSEEQTGEILVPGHCKVNCGSLRWETGSIRRFYWQRQKLEKVSEIAIAACVCRPRRGKHRIARGSRHGPSYHAMNLFPDRFRVYTVFRFEGVQK